MTMADGMLGAITPVILTYNEERNIARTLSGLEWANDIVVVDSGSTDGTLAALGADPRVRLYTRRFDSHHEQWRYAVEATDIKTPWVLRLDADYFLPPALIAEIAGLDAEGRENAFRFGFDYAIYAHKLVSSLYPPKPILFRRGTFRIIDAGHTEVWQVEGPVGNLRAKAVHDDWKPISDWIVSQRNYMARELDAPKRSDRGVRDWLRAHPPLMPVAVFFHCLFAKGLILDGRKGIFYTLQRTIAETIYALFYLERRFLSRRNDNR